METILIQETDAATMYMVITALQMAGYRVCSLTDNHENAPREMIRRYRTKLVLLDCWLSHHSGRQICHWIKAHFPRLPVIAFSCDNNIQEEYRKLGFDGYLKNPFDLEVLYRVINKHLPKHKKRRLIAQPHNPTAYGY
jgi:DNA-binding response OmpR family regulator